MAAFKFPFKNLSAYRLLPDFVAHATVDYLREQVQKLRFQENENGPVSECGWANANDAGELVYGMGKQCLLRYRVAKRVLPGGVVRDAVRRRAAQIQEKQGYKPGRKQMRDIKDMVTTELLPKAFVQTSDTLVWFDLHDGWLFIDAASAAKRDDVLGLISKTFTPFPAIPLHVGQAPASAMTGWLSANEAPEGFTLDQETELQASGESMASVRYLRETPEHEDVARQIGSGKQCIRLAMTWNDRVSFLLTQDLTIKKITPLDVISEDYERGKGENADAMYQSMFALFTGDVRGMMADVVRVLGGEVRE